MSEEKVEVFEEKVVKEEAPAEIKVVERKPEPEVKDIEEIVEEPIKMAPVKKKKRVLTDAQKAQLSENLKKGRETSLANRKKKAKLNEIAKQEKMVEEDTRIFENLKKKLKPKELEDENALLKKELAELRAMKKAEVKEERPKTPAPEERKPEEKKAELPKPIAKPAGMTTRQKMKAMKGL
jgi:hypothetical protein